MSDHVLVAFAACVLAAGAAVAAAAKPAAVLNPHVSTDRSVDCSTIDRILKSLIREEMTDEQKVVAVFDWTRRTLYHGDGARRYAYDFHKMVHVLGNGSCLRQTSKMALLCERLGYKCHSWVHHGHHMIQVFYGGKWHCFDPHMTFYCRDRADPPTIASIEQLQRDPTLAGKAVEEGRACPGYLLCGDSAKNFSGRSGWRLEFKGRWPEQTVEEPFGRIALRRGETYVRTWMPGEHWFKGGSWMKDSGPYHTCQSRDRKDTANWPLYEPHAWKGRIYRHWGAGRIEYKPDLASDHWTDAAVRQTNVATATHDGVATLGQADANRPAEVVFGVNCPYVLTAGALRFAAALKGVVKAAVSTDRGETWKPLTPKTEGKRMAATFVDEVNGSFEGYWLRLQLAGGAAVGRLELVSHFQLNPYALPYLVPGKNVVKVEADLYGSPLEVRYEWSEGPGWRTRKSSARTFNENGEWEIQVAGPKWPRMESLTLRIAP
jgi:hypothetical protein